MEDDTFDTVNYTTRRIKTAGTKVHCGIGFYMWLKGYDPRDLMQCFQALRSHIGFWRSLKIAIMVSGV